MKQTVKHPKHPDYVIGYRGPQDKLARRITRTNFNDVADFTGELGLDLIRQGVDDDFGGRKRLGVHLIFAGCHLKHAQLEMEKAAKAYDECRYPARPPRVDGYRSSRRQLAHNIGRMAFDKTVIFTGQFSVAVKAVAGKYSQESEKDFRKALLSATRHIKKAEAQLTLAWEICEPRMK